MGDSKESLKDLLAQTRSIVRNDQSEKQSGINEPKTTIEKGSEVQSDIEENKTPENIPKPNNKKQEPVTKATVKQSKPIVKSVNHPNELINSIREYDLGDDVQRMTYIIQEKNYKILNALKTESKTSIMSLINYFLDEALKAKKSEIDKIILKQYQNLK
jgi:hypothetical protein